MPISLWGRHGEALVNWLIDNQARITLSDQRINRFGETGSILRGGHINILENLQDFSGIESQFRKNSCQSDGSLVAVTTDIRLVVSELCLRAMERQA